MGIGVELGLRLEEAPVEGPGGADGLEQIVGVGGVQRLGEQMAAGPDEVTGYQAFGRGGFQGRLHPAHSG